MPVVSGSGLLKSGSEGGVEGTLWSLLFLQRPAVGPHSQQFAALEPGRVDWCVMELSLGRTKGHFSYLLSAPLPEEVQRAPAKALSPQSATLLPEYHLCWLLHCPSGVV